jgi:GT2 family glycosyltransferase
MTRRTALLSPPALPLVRTERPTTRQLATRLSIVIVNYHQWENTARLARQILGTAAAKSGAVEVVVVDNHSPPHPLGKRMRRWPGLSLRRWGRNRGFARAVNEGCRLSRGQWFLLLNPDMTLKDGFVEGVLGLADQFGSEEPKAGMVGFQLLNSDGSPQLSSGPFPTFSSTLSGLLRPRASRKYRELSAPVRCQVPWITGCCMLIRRQCLEEMHGLDNAFFLYYEDVDLCRRALERGWSVWFEPSLELVHHDPSHGRAMTPRLRLMARHSLLTYAQRHWTAWQTRVLTGIVRLEACVRRWWAHWRGDESAAYVFAELEGVAREFRQGRLRAARRRLERQA